MEVGVGSLERREGHDELLDALVLGEPSHEVRHLSALRDAHLPAQLRSRLHARGRLSEAGDVDPLGRALAEHHPLAHETEAQALVGLS